MLENKYLEIYKFEGLAYIVKYTNEKTTHLLYLQNI